MNCNNCMGESSFLNKKKAAYIANQALNTYHILKAYHISAIPELKLDTRGIDKDIDKTRLKHLLLDLSSIAFALENEFKLFEESERNLIEQKEERERRENDIRKSTVEVG